MHFELSIFYILMDEVLKGSKNTDNEFEKIFLNDLEITD
jgi:hypothetical protein